MYEIVVQAVPQRAAELTALQHALDAQGLAHRVVTHRLGDHPTATFLRCLAEPVRSPWLVRLEDDVMPCLDFRARLTSLLDTTPYRVVSGYSNRRRDLTTLAAGQPGYSIPGRQFANLPCVALRTADLQAIGEYATTWLAAHPQHPTGWDYMLGGWLHDNGLRAYVIIPSLVQHRYGRSALGHPRGSRSCSFLHQYGPIEELEDK